MDITMPVKDKIDDAEKTKGSCISDGFDFIDENDRIIWYVGMDDPSTPPVTNSADFSQSGPNGIRTMLLERNKLVLDKVKMVEDSVKAGLIPDKEDIKNIKRL